MESKARVSIIIPFYNGNKYIKKTVDNVIKCMLDIEYEIIIINDSPECLVDIDYTRYNDIVYVKNNVKNLGIHGARVEGLKLSKYEYVLFLDQDDRITSNMYESIKMISANYSPDCIVGNAIIETKEEKRYLYKHSFCFKFLNKMFFYIYDGCQIVSPGQVLIKKTSIPMCWRKSIIKKNGADDYLLWMMLLIFKKKFYYNPNGVYIHKYTSNNLSLDVLKMKESEFEAINILEQIEEISSEYVQKARRRIQFQIDVKKNSGIFKIAKLVINIKYLFVYAIVKLLRYR